MHKKLVHLTSALLAILIISISSYSNKKTQANSESFSPVHFRPSIDNLVRSPEDQPLPDSLYFPASNILWKFYPIPNSIHAIDDGDL